MPKPELLIYETKCRRCGRFNEWVYTDAAVAKEARRELWLQLACLVDDMLHTPRQLLCEGGQCQKETIQDVVSYTPFNP
jgi:hypothetical protein